MSESITFQFPQLFTEVIDMNVFTAEITAVDYENDTADIHISSLDQDFSNVEIFYHGSNTGGVSGGSEAFNIGDSVHVINPKGSCSPSVSNPFSKMRIIGFADGSRVPACQYNEDFDSDSEWTITTQKDGSETFVVSGGAAILSLQDFTDSSIYVNYKHTIDAVDCTVDIDIVGYTKFHTWGPGGTFNLWGYTPLTRWVSLGITYRYNTYNIDATIYDTPSNSIYVGYYAIPALPTKFRICRKSNLISLYYYINDWLEVPGCTDFAYGTEEAACSMDIIRIGAFDILTRGGTISFDNLRFIKGCPTS